MGYLKSCPFILHLLGGGLYVDQKLGADVQTRLLTKEFVSSVHALDESEDEDAM